MERLRLATVWLGGCSGCHMSFLDLDEFLIDLAGRPTSSSAVHRTSRSTPRASTSCWSRGRSPTRTPRDDPRVRSGRRLLVSFGDCAVTGNVTALPQPARRRPSRVLRAVYLELADLQPQIPASRGSCRCCWTG